MATKKKAAQKKSPAKTKMAIRQVSYINRDIMLQTVWLTKEIYELLKEAVEKGTYPSMIVLQVAIIETFIEMREADSSMRGSNRWFLRYYLPRHDLRKAVAVPADLVVRMKTLCERDGLNGSDFLYNAFLDWYLKNS